MVTIASFFGVFVASPTYRLEMMQSVDGTTFLTVPTWTYGGLSGNVRDPSIIYHNSKWYIAFTKVTTIGLMVSDGPGVPFTDLPDIDVSSIGSIVATWAPEWFVEPSDGSLHLTFTSSLTPINFGLDRFQPYEVHPTNAGLTTWSTPVSLTSVDLPNSIIDTQLVKVGSTYYLWYCDKRASEYVSYASSSSMTGPYTVQKSGNWAGWGTFMEGPCLVLQADGTTWRIYFDEALGTFDSGQIKYSDSTDNWATWTTKAPIGQDVVQTKHGTVVLFENDLFGEVAQVINEFPAMPTTGQIQNAGSMSGFQPDWTARLGKARLGALRLGDGDRSFGAAVAISPGVGLHTDFTAGVRQTLSNGIILDQAMSTSDQVSLAPGVGLHTDITETMRAPVTLTPAVTLDTEISAQGAASIAPGVGLHTGFSIGDVGISVTLTEGIGIGAHFFAPVDVTIVVASGVRIAVTPGAPAVQGGAVTVINQTGVRISVTPGMPAVNGGIQYLQCFIGNVDRSAYLIPMGVSQPRLGGGGGGGGTGSASSGPVTITSNAIGRASATFDLFVGDLSGWVPRAKETVILQEFGKKLFAGCLKSVTTDPIQPGFTKPIFHCIGTDKSSICDNRVVIKTYPVGTGIQAMVLDIVANFLDGEGITTEGVNVTGTLDAPMVFNTVSVTQAFDQITQFTGAQWWVDMNGILNFSVIDNAPAAPFSITGTSNNFRNLVATETLVGFANKFYAVSNLVVQPGGSGASGAAREETYTMLNIGGLPYQQRAFDAGLAPGYLLLDMPINTLVFVSVNGVSKPVFGITVQPYDTPGWYYFDGSNTAAVVFPFNTPSIGDVILVRYIPLFQNATVVAADPLSGTCGSGIIEGIIQVPNISFQDELDSIAEAYQARNGVIPYIVSFETDTPGLAVGQALPCNISAIGLGSTSLYITSVTAVRAGAGQFDLGAQSSFRWVIESSTQQNLGNWVNWFEQFIKRTQFPLPLPRYDRAKFILAPGSSLAAGTVATNPDPVQNAGAVFQASVIAETPPVGQDLLVNFLINGVPVFASGAELILPAGSTALAVTTTFATPGLFVYQNNVITIVTAYRVLTANPVAASNVTATLNWSY